MSIKTFNFELTRQGDNTEVTKAITDAKGQKDFGATVLYAIDALCANPENLKTFSNSFSKEWNAKNWDSEKQTIKFRALTEAEMETQKNFDITQTSTTPTIATTVIPSLEALIRSTEILSRVNIINRGANTNYQMFDFDSEQNAAILSEVAAGTDIDEVLRTGDRLTPNQKVQASMKISDFVMKSLDLETLGKYIARLARRVQNSLCVAILANGSGAANGTARGDNIRGILNNYGVNGTGDASNTIGAVAYATKAAVDLVITGLGGTASSDAYDLVYKASLFLLPSNLQDVEEGEYVMIGNRYSWATIATVKDLNGRYLATSAIDPLTGKITKQVSTIPFLVVPTAQVQTSRVYLVPLKMYTLVLEGDILNLNDGGIVQLKEGLVQFVSRTYAAGSMEYAQKFRPTTVVTAGVTAPDNLEQNAFRVINLV